MAYEDPVRRLIRLQKEGARRQESDEDFLRRILTAARKPILFRLPDGYVHNVSKNGRMTTREIIRHVENGSD